MELNEIIALAYNAGIGLTVARRRLLYHVYIEHMPVEKLFAPQVSPLIHKVYTYRGNTGSIIKLAYENDCNVGTMRSMIKDDETEAEVVEDLKESLKALGKRRSVDDIPDGGTWESKHLKPTTFTKIGTVGYCRLVI